jgi:hypothetical protein
MKTKFIPAEDSFKNWKRDPKDVAAYNLLEEEFTLVSAMIKGHSPEVGERNLHGPE